MYIGFSVRVVLRRAASGRHVEEEGCDAGATASDAVVSVLPGFLAVLAAERERQRAQTYFADLAVALETAPVGAIVEAAKRLVDLVECLRLHLDERKIDVLSDTGFGPIAGVERDSIR